MRQWIGLIVVLAGAYYVFTQYGDRWGGEQEPATPDVAWYLEHIQHHFTIVPERGPAWFFRGVHENATTTTVENVRVKVYLRDGETWAVLDTYELGELRPEARKTVDKPIRVPAGIDKPKLRWEIVDVRRR